MISMQTFPGSKARRFPKDDASKSCISRGRDHLVWYEKQRDSMLISMMEACLARCVGLIFAINTARGAMHSSRHTIEYHYTSLPVTTKFKYR